MKIDNTVMVPTDKNERTAIEQKHHERLEHARAQCFLELLAIKCPDVQYVLRRWGLKITEDGRYSAIGYPVDFKDKLYQGEMGSEEGTA